MHILDIGGRNRSNSCMRGHKAESRPTRPMPVDPHRSTGFLLPIIEEALANNGHDPVKASKATGISAHHIAWIQRLMDRAAAEVLK